jgi:mannosyl-oligosaccharide alpha-1,3-glucosidase
MYHDGNLQIVANDRNLLHFEHSRERRDGNTSRQLSDANRHQGKEVADYGEDGLAIYTDGTKEEKRKLSVEGTRRSSFSCKYYIMLVTIK